MKFGLAGTDLVLTGPDGERFESLVQQVEKRKLGEGRAEHAEERTELAEVRVEQAEKRAEQEAGRAEQAEARAARLAARLRELGVSEEDVYQ